MAVKKKRYKLQQGDVIDIEEYHDGRYGAPGKKRQKRKTPTKEEMQKVNDYNKTKRCRLRMLEHIRPGDCFATLTYEISRRPPDMKTAKEHFRKMLEKTVRKEYRKRGSPLFWFRNIERGTKGAWHIHLVITETGDTASILKKAWKHGGVHCIEIKLSDKFYDEDFTKLASYMTKNERTEYTKADGTQGKPRIAEASYSHSRNMPLPEPRVRKLKRWKKHVEPEKGYYIARCFEGINPVTGYKYRRYTMIRLHRRI